MAIPIRPFPSQSSPTSTPTDAPDARATRFMDALWARVAEQDAQQAEPAQPPTPRRKKRQQT